MAKHDHHLFHPDDVDVVFDELVSDLRKRKRVVGHGRIFAAIEVDEGGHVTDYRLATDRLTDEDVDKILREPPRGHR